MLAVRRDRPRFEAVVRCAAVAAAFLSGLKEGHDLSTAGLLVRRLRLSDRALARSNLSGQPEYTDRNTIEKWFQTLKMRINRFHNFWNGARRFRHYYNFQRPNQAIDNRTPVEEVLNR